MPYLFIKIGVEELTPGFVAWSRVALAAIVLLPLAIKTGALRGLPLRWLVAFAAVEIAIPFPLIGFGEQRISSSLAAILIAALPLVVAFLALRFDHAERPTPVRLVGMLVGLSGVVALVGIDIGGRGAELLGAAAVLTATLGYACGPLIVKRHLAGADPLGPVTAAMAIASIMLLPFGIGDFPTETPATDTLVAIVVLGLVCSAAAGLLLILAGSWLATDGRVPPGLAAIVTRGRERRGAKAAARPAELRG